MHLIVDIRSASPTDPIITRYASNWVNLWKIRHPRDLVSYIHFDHQKCPENGKSIIVKSVWYGRRKRISVPGVHEIFRCVNFSPYGPYDKRIDTISHIFDHAKILYPKLEQSWIMKLVGKNIRNNIQKSHTIIVPSLAIGQETVDIIHVREEDIEIIPYTSFSTEKGDRRTLHQLSISGPYWIYDGSYGSEANIHGLLKGYKDYRKLGGSHLLMLMGQSINTELRHISDLIQKMDLTGFVRIIGALEDSHTESLYTYASGWIYIGAYYASGPRIELARSHHIPLLISQIASLSDYQNGSITIHPNHLSNLGESLRNLEYVEKKYTKKISDEDIMKGYEKILSEKR